MNERVLNTHGKGERVKIPLLPKQSKIEGARQRQWSRQLPLMIYYFIKRSLHFILNESKLSVSQCLSIMLFNIDNVQMVTVQIISQNMTLHNYNFFGVIPMQTLSDSLNDVPIQDWPTRTRLVDFFKSA